MIAGPEPPGWARDVEDETRSAIEPVELCWGFLYHFAGLGFRIEAPGLTLPDDVGDPYTLEAGVPVGETASESRPMLVDAELLL